MRYISFVATGRLSYGIAVGNGVFDLGVRFGTGLPDLKSYLAARGIGALGAGPAPSAADYGPAEFALLPVIPNPEKILCVGLNYEDHRKETGRPQSAHPSIFTRFADTLIAAEAPIILPSVSSALDYEGEFAVVIGKGGFRVPEEHALDLVAGYTLFNDVTLRDWQRHTHQFIPGKNFPATGPFGPELVTPEEFGAIGPQKIETRLNGQLMQSATLADMIFSVPRIISYISSFTRLRPGDVIATGTPGGVGFKRDPQLFMQNGDRIEIAIEGLGRLSNPVASDI